jgi:hypothetical protein
MDRENERTTNYISLLKLCELEFRNSNLSYKHKYILIHSIGLNKTMLIASYLAVDENGERELQQIYEMLRALCTRSSRESLH